MKNYIKKELIRFIMNEDRYLFINGKAGTGKTVLIGEIYNDWGNLISSSRIIDSELDFNLDISSTTHKSAAVLTQTLNDKVSTVFKLLNLRLVNKGQATYLSQVSKPVLSDDTVLIIDEYSFINDRLLEYIEESPYKKVIFVGDPYQLLAPKQYTLATKELQGNVIELTEIYRTDKDDIRELNLQMYETVKTGICKKIPLSENIFHVPKEDFLAMVKEGSNNSNQVVICGTNVAVEEYNKLLQAHNSGHESLSVGQYCYSNSYNKEAGLKNNEILLILSKTECTHPTLGLEGYYYSVMSENGTVEVFIPNSLKEKAQAISKAVKEQKYLLADQINTLADLRPGYAMTAYKAQGSSFDTVYIDLNSFKSLKRNVDSLYRALYVLVSRARNKIVFTGDI